MDYAVYCKVLSQHSEAGSALNKANTGIIIESWEYSSAAEHLPSVCEVLGSIPSPTKKKKSGLKPGASTSLL
jgi:hypothetical protein